VSQQAIGAPHSPHDDWILRHQSHRSLGHASPRGNGDTSPKLAFLTRAARRGAAKVPGRKTKDGLQIDMCRME
jgi:hypothetical protein